MDSATNRNINILLVALGTLAVIGACLTVFGFLWPLIQAKASWPLLVLAASCVVALLLGLGRSLFRAGYHHFDSKQDEDKPNQV